MEAYAVLYDALTLGGDCCIFPVMPARGKSCELRLPPNDTAVDDEKVLASSQSSTSIRRESNSCCSAGHLLASFQRFHRFH